MVAKIKALCKEKNISITELAKRCDIPQSYVYRWDRNRPSIDIVKKVSEVLETTIDELVADDSDIIESEADDEKI